MFVSLASLRLASFQTENNMGSHQDLFQVIPGYIWSKDDPFDSFIHLVQPYQFSYFGSERKKKRKEI